MVSRWQRPCALIAVAMLAAAAIGVHGLAAGLVRDERFVTLGPGSRVLVVLLLAFLLILAARHLVMLAMASWDHWTRLPPAAQPTGALPFVSIIVPAYNEGAMIAEVIKSLLSIDYPSFEIIIVDDGSAD